MTDHTSSSVSKGVFVYKGSKSVANAEDYFSHDETDAQMQVDRFQVYDELWENINAKIQILQSDLNTRIFDELLTYVTQAQAGFHFDSAIGCHQKAVQEIPTVALVTGINMPDHAVMFTNLVTLLKDRVSPHVAVLRSKDCSTLKSILANMMSQLMTNHQQIDDDEEDDEGVIVQVKRNRRCTMPVLSNWYYNTVHEQSQSSPSKRSPHKGGSSPRKKQRSENTTTVPPVVIVLEDFERFPPNVLQDFIIICSSYLNRLPIVLVFGIATAVCSVHKLLCNSVSALLCMEKFQAPPCTQYLAQVIDEVVMSADIPFKLGSRSFNLLLDVFLYHDFSVINFVRGFQFSMMEHFFTEPFSILCQPLSESLARLRGLDDLQLDHIRTCASYSSYVDSKREQDQAGFLEDSGITRQFISQCLHQLHRHSVAFFPVLRCLHTLVCKLPRYPLGKQVREVYALCLAANIYDSTAYKDAFNLIRALSRDELHAMLVKCHSHLIDSSNVPDDLVPIAQHVKSLQEKFENIDELAKEYAETEAMDSGETPMELPKKTDMYTLRKTLVSMERKKKKLTVYEVFRDETIDYMDSIFRKHLQCPSNLTLHEIFYFNDAMKLKAHVNPSIRATIQRGLANPYAYLQCDSLKMDGDSISPQLPDVSIVYKLHLECGRLINLYDWLQAFIAIINGDMPDDDDDARKPDITLQARFIRAVSELQFLGFIKSTRRKTDHVARLTW